MVHYSTTERPTVSSRNMHDCALHVIFTDNEIKAACLAFTLPMPACMPMPGLCPCLRDYAEVSSIVQSKWAWYVSHSWAYNS